MERKMVKAELEKEDQKQFYLEVVEMEELEKIAKWEGQMLLKSVRMKIWYLKALLVFLCGKVVRSKLFDNLVLVVIIWNSFLQTIP